MKPTIDSHTMIARLLLFSIGLLMSFNNFAAPTYATTQDLDAEISNRINADIAEATTRGNADASLQNQIDALQAQIDSVFYKIGGPGPAGGIVFYINGGGAVGLHGLEAAPVDQSNNAVIWGCFATSIAGADGTAVGTGAQNTADILAGCTSSGIAAEFADNYSLNNYTDWFLPSKDELNLMYTKIGPGASIPLTNVGGFFANDSYWSSTETDKYYAGKQDFSSGIQGINNKDLKFRSSFYPQNSRSSSVSTASSLSVLMSS